MFAMANIRTEEKNVWQFWTTVTDSVEFAIPENCLKIKCALSDGKLRALREYSSSQLFAVQDELCRIDTVDTIDSIGCRNVGVGSSNLEPSSQRQVSP